MGSMRLEIQWSPLQENRFITWGTEIFLYEVEELKDDFEGSGYIKISNNTVAHLLATNSSYRYVKCIDIYPQPIADTLLAIGQANGKVVLSTFGPSNVEAVGQEFTPKHPRQCNAIGWNPLDSNIIAVGLDKYKSDHAVLLWDVSRCPHHYSSDERQFMKPVMEIALSETANSLAWINSTSMIVGLSSKMLKIVDRRDSGRTVNTTLTKAVYGATVDPHNEHILASFFDNQICVWDDRNFEKPISTISRQKHVNKISWCPTRHNLLGSLQRDSSIIMLHDLQLSTVGNDEVEPALLERPVIPNKSNQSYITSFSWHPTVESRLLTISLSTAITDYYVVERITLNWLPCSHLVWTHGRRTLKLFGDKDPVYDTFEDISVKAKRRALANYGLKQELWQNGELAEDDNLKHLWNWLYHSKSLVEEGIIKNAVSSHPGVVYVLNMEPSRVRSEWVNVNSTDLNTQSFAKVYTSDERDCALQLCGWKFDKDVQALTSYLERLQAEGAFSRAAAISVFNLRLKLAIAILSKGASKHVKNQNLGIVAMALAGFSEDRNTMWREHCISAKSKLQDPYLRATFAFLTSENENYESVLSEQGMAVEDRVAFACRFLTDNKLSEYLYKLTDKLTEEGDLSGLLLTGASLDGVKLLQRYLDMTGDIQSVSLIAMRAFPTEIQADHNVQNWIMSYQQFLDTRRLWNQRAQFDISFYSSNQADKPSQRVFISCTFCGKSISSYMAGINRTRGQLSRLGPSNNKMKVTSCPNCRKPLPRCSICLVHMGTPSGIVGGGETDEKMADMSTWFTWCQSCRHGGHAGHMSDWFSAHSECPVTGCNCRCLSLDSACKTTL